MMQVTRPLLAVLVVTSLGCPLDIAVTGTADPTSCSEDATLVYAWDLDGHAPVRAKDYPSQLCEWDGTVLSAGERRRMGRDTSHYRVGLAWANRGEPERAIAAFRRDLEGATTSFARVEDHVAIAQVLSAAGEHERALRELEACDEELDGARAGEVEDARAEVFVAMGRRLEAIAVLEARPPSDGWGDSAQAQLRVAELWLEESEPERARVAYEAALADEHCEEYPWGYEANAARLGLVRVLLAEHRPQEALESLDGLRHVREYAEAWRLRAEIQRELNNPWGAAASLRKAFELEHYDEPSELDRANHRSELASLHLLADRPDLAYSGFEAAYRTYARELGPLDRDTLIAAHDLGVACLDLDDPEQARTWLMLAATGHEAAAGEPFDRGHTQLHLARAEQRSGLHDKAARSFTAALGLLGELDDPRLTDNYRARMYREATRAFLDVGSCDQALETIELAKEFSRRIGEDKGDEDLTGNNTRLWQLRQCSAVEREIK